MLAGSSVLYHLPVPVFLRDKWHRFLQSGSLSYRPPAASLFLSSEGKKNSKICWFVIAFVTWWFAKHKTCCSSSFPVSIGSATVVTWALREQVQCQASHKPGILADLSKHGILSEFCATSGKIVTKKVVFIRHSNICVKELLTAWKGSWTNSCDSLTWSERWMMTCCIAGVDVVQWPLMMVSLLHLLLLQ